MIRKLKSFIGRRKLATALAVLGLGAFLYSSSADQARTLAPTTDVEMSETSVKITNLSKRSGGTGVILRSTLSESTILTNAHVCEVTANSGLVTTRSGESHAVTGYKASNDHDLCLITVAANLGINTNLAPSGPGKHASAAISGHPRLLPNVVTRGHFSGRNVIQVMTGVRKCTIAELKGDSFMICFLLGGIPIIRNYEAQLVTATIMPGSSGSAVFNKSGDINGVVFAGSGGLGYAYIVPHESVVNFVSRESLELPFKRPNSQFELSFSSERASEEQVEQFVQVKAKIRAVCPSLGAMIAAGTIDQSDYSKLKDVCEVAQRDALWTN